MKITGETFTVECNSSSIHAHELKRKKGQFLHALLQYTAAASCSNTAKAGAKLENPRGGYGDTK